MNRTAILDRLRKGITFEERYGLHRLLARRTEPVKLMFLVEIETTNPRPEQIERKLCRELELKYGENVKVSPCEQQSGADVAEWLVDDGRTLHYSLFRKRQEKRIAWVNGG